MTKGAQPLDHDSSDIALPVSIPKGWRPVRLKSLLAEVDIRAGDSSPVLLGLSREHGVVPRADIGASVASSDDYSKYKLVRSGQLVMNKMQAWNGAFGVAQQEGMISPDYTVLEALDTSYLDFLTLLFRTDAMADVFRIHSRGIGTGFLRLQTADLLSLKVALPPKQRVREFVQLVHAAVARIDALITEQERLIALLQEKWQAAISQAVTKGLDPNVPLKDSGMHWIGEVPAHWDIGPLKRSWHVIDCKHVTPDFTDDGFPLASIREVQGRWVELRSAKRTTEYFYQLLIEGERKPRAGDLILSRNATVGEVAQVAADHPPFAMGQDVVLLRKKQESESSDYLQHVVRSPLVTTQLDLLMVGSTFRRINVEEVRSIVIPRPAPEEQRIIARHLQAEAERADAVLSDAARAIALLSERRAALITAAVTGQIGVRGLAETAT